MLRPPTDRLLRRFGSLEAARSKFGLFPRARLRGRAGGDRGRAAVFLARAAATFMTGNDLLVDGGYTAI
jgi:NAD(P)-dependent dehydrogenase (short-subunit alcohol dehydrogenase family)